MSYLPRLVAVLALIGGMAEANAHAMLDHAAPAVGSTVNTAPVTVTLWFTEPVERAFSTVQVLDQRGQRVDQPPLESSEATALRVALKPLPPGVYQVVWRVVSVDTHVIRGEFTFQVAP